MVFVSYILGAQMLADHSLFYLMPTSIDIHFYDVTLSHIDTASRFKELTHISRNNLKSYTKLGRVTFGGTFCDIGSVVNFAIRVSSAHQEVAYGTKPADFCEQEK